MPIAGLQLDVGGEAPVPGDGLWGALPAQSVAAGAQLPHSVVAPASAANVQVGVRTLSGVAGAEVIVTVGPPVSRVYVSVAAGPVLPTPSVARTLNW